MKHKTSNPRRVSGKTAARVVKETISLPRTGYAGKHCTSRPSTAVVVTPSGLTFPYLIKRLPDRRLVLAKKVNASTGFLRQPPAIAFDTTALAWAYEKGARVVEVTDRESGTIYRALLTTILHQGFRINRGFGEQVALKLDRWQAGDNGQLELLGV